MVKVAAVKTLKSLFSARDRVKLDVDVALRVGINSDVHDLPVFLVAFGLDLAFEVLDPAVAVGLLFPVYG